MWQSKDYSHKPQAFPNPSKDRISAQIRHWNGHECPKALRWSSRISRNCQISWCCFLRFINSHQVPKWFWHQTFLNVLTMVWGVACPNRRSSSTEPKPTLGRILYFLRDSWRFGWMMGTNMKIMQLVRAQSLLGHTSPKHCNWQLSSNFWAFWQCAGWFSPHNCENWTSVVEYRLIGYSLYSYHLVSLCSCFFPRLHPRLGGGCRAKEAKPSKSKAPKKDQKEKEETKKPKVSATQIFGVFYHVNVRKHWPRVL